MNNGNGPNPNSGNANAKGPFGNGFFVDGGMPPGLEALPPTTILKQKAAGTARKAASSLLPKPITQAVVMETATATATATPSVMTKTKTKTKTNTKAKKMMTVLKYRLLMKMRHKVTSRRAKSPKETKPRMSLKMMAIQA